MQQRAGDFLRTLPQRKLVTICYSFAILAALLLWTHSSGYLGAPAEPEAVKVPPVATPADTTPIPPPAPLLPSWYIANLASCGNETHAETRKVWLEADAQYAHLADDKFTIAIPTYKRPDVLNGTLAKLLNDKIPSLHEIVVIWNELDKAPPSGFVSKHGVAVRYRTSERNSLNNRLFPDPEYQTQAVLTHDDDVWYEPDDVEFVFQTWRQLGRYRLTGALPRCYSRNDKGLLQYHQCRDGSDWYALILTGLSFVHVSFLDYYWSDEAIPTRIRQHVDEAFNCEDLAMNYVASMLTCAGPLNVIGKHPYTNLDPKGGISRKGNHMPLRHNCLNVFEHIVGFLPLVHSMGSIKRGTPHFN